jgi:hypothetical protein
MCLSGRGVVLGSHVPFKYLLVVGSLYRCGKGIGGSQL